MNLINRIINRLQQRELEKLVKKTLGSKGFTYHNGEIYAPDIKTGYFNSRDREYVGEIKTSIESQGKPYVKNFKLDYRFEMKTLAEAYERIAGKEVTFEENYTLCPFVSIIHPELFKRIEAAENARVAEK